MSTVVHWFRRDLRVRDNTALHAAASAADALAGIFVIDPRWFGNADAMGPHQAAFYLAALRELRQTLAGRNMPLVVRTSSDPVGAVLALARELGAGTISYNKDYEPAQVAQDMRLEREAAAGGMKAIACKDQVVFEEHELLTGAGTLFSVFTPYRNAWLKRLTSSDPGGLPRRMSRGLRISLGPIPTPEEIGYPAVALDIPTGEAGGRKLLTTFVGRHLPHYASTRDYPAHPHSTSRLSAHLAAGTVSIRQALHALGFSGTRNPGPGTRAFLTELIWREFYKMILFNHPHTVAEPFHDRYARLTWSSDPARFAAWAEGRTGYPIIDAAMRQLLARGFMHNRLRMLTSMFLTKDLDCHWKLGERFFMQHLVDYDQAANVGGWQWSASTGTDAAPYFRIMNPVLQSQRYDPDGVFVRRYLPALSRVPARYLHAPWTMPADVQQEARCVIGRDYPAPIVDHAVAKQQAVAKFRRRR